MEDNKKHNALRYQELRVLRTEQKKRRLRLEVLSELTNRIEVMDVLDYLDLLPDESIQLIVTSPPYNLGKEYEARRHLVYYVAGWSRCWRSSTGCSSQRELCSST
jgi:tRNA1(Val) A37 N6-methylase TrmN6